MPAQAGNAVLLQYGAQGTPQNPAAVVLSYDSPGQAGTVRIRAQTTGRWARSAARTNEIAAPTPATEQLVNGRTAAWPKGVGTDQTGRGDWGKISQFDSSKSAPWGAFGPQHNLHYTHTWSPSARLDRADSAPWGAFGPLFSREFVSAWYGALRRDAERSANWQGQLIPTLKRIPFVRPTGGACNFTVVGGGVDSAVFGNDAYTPPAGNALFFQFGDSAYRIPFMVGQSPTVFGTDFVSVAQYELVLDGTGNPVLDKATRDPEQRYPWGVSAGITKETKIPWLKFSRPMNPGWGIVTPGSPQPPEPGQTLTIPVQRVYIVVNEILLIRVVGSVPIIAENLNVSFDCDSWLPTFSATIHETARDAVMPDPSPVEVNVHINGSDFRFFVEKVVRNRSFGRRTVSISGRGIACELDAPFAVASQHTNTIDKTAQQIIDSALGFSTYTQTWNITDWLVPANAFSLFGTPAQVAAAVADASGSVLQADWSSRDLRMLPRYGVKPWDWATATPEYVIPAAVAQTESLEWLEKPDYNVVYVSGERVGVLGQVKRTGTAGDKPAPMVTNSLITHADAARQRGTSVLCDTGRKAIMQLSTPVLAETGVIDVCRLIEFSDGANTRRGIVRANNVSVNWPTVRQTLTIEAAV